MRRDPKPDCIYVVEQGSFRAGDAGVKPVPSDMPGVRGVYVGGCVRRGIGRIDLETSCPEAHAHNHRRSPHFGWVCFQLPEYFEDKATRAHELAHIRVPGEGHTDRWRAEMIRLGQVIEPRYQPRRRTPKKSS